MARGSDRAGDGRKSTDEARSLFEGRVRRLRKQVGLSQEGLAEAAGLRTTGREGLDAQKVRFDPANPVL